MGLFTRLFSGLFGGARAGGNCQNGKCGPSESPKTASNRNCPGGNCNSPRSGGAPETQETRQLAFSSPGRRCRNGNCD